MTTQIITGAYTSGIVLSNGNYTNPVTVASTGSVYGSSSGLSAFTAWGIVNQGNVSGGTFGVYLDAGGSVTNAAGGTITSSHYAGIFVRDVGTVDNAGSISAADKCVYLRNGGFVTNVAGGDITAGAFGVIVTGASGVVENAGGISAGGYEGVVLGGGGSVTNLSGGTITGGIIGVDLVNASGTVENAGTISGSAGAVNFSVGDSTLIVDAGAVFNGAVTANGTGNILQLSATNTAQTLSNLGSQFTDFQTLVFETGATWTAAGSFTGVTTIGGFHPGDTLDLTGLSYAATDTVTLTNSNVLEVLDNGDNVLWSAQLESESLTTADYTGKVFQLANDGSDGIDITVGNATTSWIAAGAGDWSTAADWSAGQAPNSTAIDPTIANATARVSILAGQSFQVNQLTIDDGAELILAGSLTAAAGLTLSARTVWIKGGSLTAPVSLAAGTIVKGSGTISGSAANSGRIDAIGLLDLTGPVSGTGVLTIGNDATLELGAAASQTIAFTPGTGETLILDAPGNSFGVIRGFMVGDTIDLKGVTASKEKLSHGVTTFLDGTVAVATLTFGSTFPGYHLVLTSDKAGGTDVTLAAGAPAVTPSATDQATSLFAQAITVHSAPLSPVAEPSAVNQLHENLPGVIAASLPH